MRCLADKVNQTLQWGMLQTDWEQLCWKGAGGAGGEPAKQKPAVRGGSNED